MEGEGYRASGWGENSECVNTVVAHTCTCKAGWQGDGNTCTGKKAQPAGVGELSSCGCYEAQDVGVGGSKNV